MRKQRNKKFQKNISGCITVTAQECGDNNERMVRKFIKKAKKEGIVEEFRSRTRFKKPSVLKSEKKANRQRVIDKVNRDRDELFNPSSKRTAKRSRRRR
jgi:ribosomal protein S21